MATPTLAPPAPATPSVPTMDPMAATAPPRPRRGVGRLLRDLRTTTPGRLRVESLIVIVLAVAAGLVSSAVIAQRTADTSDITGNAAPVIVSARQVQTNLAEANAAAANSFLAGGTENAAQRANYEESLAAAARELEQAARLVGDDDEAHAALQTLNVGLPTYAGLIETARANNRQGFPVGAAYLNSAARLLEDELYPAADVVANRAAAGYRDAYDHQRNLGLIYGLAAVGLNGLLVAYLAWLLNHLRRRFKRTVNVPLALALAVAVALTGWLSYGLASHTSHLEQARTDGYEGTRLYLDARTIGFGAKADEARFLIARGAGQAFEDRFQTRMGQLDATWDSISSHAATSAHPEAGANLDASIGAWTDYVAVHDAAVGADVGGDRDGAVALALEDANTSFAAFDDATAAALSANRDQFGTEMDRAGQALAGLRFGPLIAVLVVAAAAAYGLQLRINEYR